MEALKKLSRETGISQSFLIRIVIDDPLKDKEKLKKKLFPHWRNESLERVYGSFSLGG